MVKIIHAQGSGGQNFSRGGWFFQSLGGVSQNISLGGMGGNKAPKKISAAFAKGSVVHKFSAWGDGFPPHGHVWGRYCT